MKRLRLFRILIDFLELFFFSVSFFHCHPLARSPAMAEVWPRLQRGSWPRARFASEEGEKYKKWLKIGSRPKAGRRQGRRRRGGGGRRTSFPALNQHTICLGPAMQWPTDAINLHRGPLAHASPRRGFYLQHGQRTCRSREAWWRRSRVP